MIKLKDKRGAALIFVFIIFVGLSSMALAFLIMINYQIRSIATGVENMKAFNIAEAGRAKARWALTEGGESVGWGESDKPFGDGTYTVTTVDNGDDTCTITSEGYIPDSANPVARRRVVEEDIPTTSGLLNLSLDAAATASSSQGQNTPEKAIDGDPTTTRWRSSVDGASWLKLDFGSSTTFDRIVYTSAKITTYTIQYSNDDSVYIGVTNPVENPAGTVNFDSVSARYLRFNVNGNRPSVYELETYNSAGGATPTLGQGKFITSW